MPIVNEEKAKEPLWLPRGSIRAILAIFLIVSSVVTFFVKTANNPAALYGFAGMALAYYFESRKNESNTK